MDMMSYLMGQNSAIKKGMKVEVVTELPDTGVSNVLYLVPKENTGDNDIFDEYLWVDNDWEHIGSTDIDLSNYYTKSEVNNLLSSIPQTIYEIYFDGAVYLYDSPMAAFITSSTEKERATRQKMEDAINDAFKNGLRSFTILFGNYTNKSMAYMQNENLQAKPTTINFRGFDKKGGRYEIGYNRYLTTLHIVIEGSWNNDKFTLSGFYYLAPSFDMLTLDNVRTYTPSGDYNPATKKYVDDSITTAITDALGGSY